MVGVLSRWGSRRWLLGLAAAVPVLMMPMAAHAQRGWGVPDTVAAPVTAIYNGGLAVDAAGVVTAAWIEVQLAVLQNPTYAVKASRRGAGGWSVPVTLTLTSPDRVEHVTLAASAGGDVMVLWTGAAGILASRYSAAAGSWAPVTLVAPAPDAQELRVALDPAGNAIALWSRVNVGVAGARYDAVAQAWGAVRDFGSGEHPLVGMDADGNALVVWTTLRTVSTAPSTVWFSRFAAASGQWTAPTVLDSAPIAGAVDLRMDPDGTAALVWAAAGSSSDVAWKVALFSPTTGTWEASTTVSTDSRLQALALALGPADVVVVWADGQNVVHRRFDRAANTGWSAPAPIATGSAYFLEVEADALGGVVAAWADDGDWSTIDRVFASRFSHATGAWAPAVPVSVPGLQASFPDVVVAPTGTATVAWTAELWPVEAMQAVQWDATLPAPSVVDLTAAPGTLTVAFTPLTSPLPELAPQTVEFSIDDGATWTARTAASAASPVVIDGLTDFVPYRVRLRLVNAAGAGLASPPLAARPGAGSVLPTDLVATSIAGNSVTLEWMPPAVGVVPTGYVLEGGVVPGQVLGGVVTSGTAPTVTFAAPTGVFFVRVHALTPLPGGRSGPSNEIRLVVNVPELPSAPRDLLGMVNGSSIALSWTNTLAGGAPTGVVLMASGPVSGAIPLGRAETFQFASVPPGTYTFAVVATNASGASAPSNAVSLTFPAACSGTPGPPTRFVAQASGSTVRVSWAPPQTGAAATLYRLSVSGAFAGSFPLTTREITGNVPPGTYTFRVTAENACGAGAATAPVTLVVP